MILTQVPDPCKRSDRSPTAEIDRLLLRQVSPNDAKWDARRSECDRVTRLYHDTVFDALAGRLEGCSERLEFKFDIAENNTTKLKLRSAWFCRVRTCPVCQWRRSLMWRAKAFKVLPKVIEKYPKHRFIFLTLTVRNCAIADLRATLGKMGKAWGRLVKRKDWPAVGWMRAVEVTREKDKLTGEFTGNAHPHYHCLLMVKPSYFSGHSYLSQERWTQLWQESLQVDYPPMVDVRAVKPKKGAPVNDVTNAILETLKYTVKPADLIGKSEGEPKEEDSEWLIELTSQLHKTRGLATGGILKQYLRELEEEPDDLIHADEDGKTDEEGLATVNFDWHKNSQHYLLTPDSE